MRTDPTTLSPASARALGLAVGVVLDRALGDPARFHPVAGMGSLAGRAERALYADTRSAGVMFTALCVGSAVAVGVPADRRGGLVRCVATAASTWAVLGGTSLARVGGDIADALERDDVDAGRALIPSLCGRDPLSLDGQGMVRAALESVAENTSDATVAPLAWGAIAGVPGLLGYRMINTLDAMVGYRSPRHLRFGWASARLDDVANHLPARLTGVLIVVVGPRRRDALRAWRRDAHRHPSPNAGVVESTFAGALGVGLGGTTVYRHRTEERPRLGDGPPPSLTDLHRAVTLSRRVQLAAAVVATLTPLVVRRRQSP
ncbi:cobalamin biosynthesis protein [Williamsia maris]|uniref:Cobalamin biosynthesis protein CobD n=1 Tax=Williamsia maris TaxID=72806 RepID=A0ABT1HI87_9NOCA|nr:cobalamin biosynthesis protein [Williamsia maris]MCP2177046.1 adenosylcobinamide-phosphate synthase [Williamsia maris]